MATTARNFDLDTALGDAETRFIDANPRSAERHKQACAFLPGGNTRTVLHYGPLPVAIVRGDGCQVWDADGHQYIDFVCEYSAGLYGHSNPIIEDAIRGALSDGVVLGGPNQYEAKLAKQLTSRFPGLELVRFCNSGSEADLMVLSVARAITGRNKVLVFEEAYHGGFLIFGHGGSPLNAPFEFVKATYNDIDASVAVIDANAGDLAAVIMEPMMGAGGCIPATPEFLRAMREATERTGTILIFDEVITSRMSFGGMQAMYNVIPDMTTVGKYLGGGLTFGAFGGKTHIMSRFDPSKSDRFFHAGTFNNNVLTMAAGLAGLENVLSEESLNDLNELGNKLRRRLCELFADKGVAATVTGLGSMMNVHFTNGPINTPADIGDGTPDLKRLMQLDLNSRGLYVTPRAMLALSLPMGEKETNALHDGIACFIDDYRPLLPNR